MGDWSPTHSLILIDCNLVWLEDIFDVFTSSVYYVQLYIQDIDLRLNPVTKNQPDYRLFIIHMLIRVLIRLRTLGELFTSSITIG